MAPSDLGSSQYDPSSPQRDLSLFRMIPLQGSCLCVCLATVVKVAVPCVLFITVSLAQATFFLFSLLFLLHFVCDLFRFLEIFQCLCGQAYDFLSL